MTTTKKQFRVNPSATIKTSFTYRFLKALKKLNKKKLITSSSSEKETCRRSHKVKMAAYASMASAVGSRRTWSRVLLYQIRNRRLISRRRAVIRRSKSRLLLRRSSRGENPREDFGFGEATRLRKLVPGGESMDVYSLLDETAHYIKCLTMQRYVLNTYIS